MARRADTRDQIMDRANDLLLQRGYNGFSYRDISEHLGVRNAAVHYHFPTKADLAEALVNSYHGELRQQTYDFMINGGAARPQLEGLFLFTLKQACCGRSLCPVGALSVDYEELPDKVRRAAGKLGHDTHRWLSKVLEDGRRQGEFDFTGRPADRALLIISALQGARQLARVDGDRILEAVIDDIRRGLGVADEAVPDQV